MVLAVLLVIGLLIGLLIGVVVLSPKGSKNRGGQRRSGRLPPADKKAAPQVQSAGHDTLRLGDAKAQLEFVSKVDFEPRRLLNRSEYGVLKLLEKTVRHLKSRHRVMAQVSLGQVIGTSRSSGSTDDLNLAFRAINSKRLDFLIIDGLGMPTLAVEYQGTGHYREDAALRDEVKRKALQKAKIRLLEIPAEYDVGKIEQEVVLALESGLKATKRQTTNR